MSRCEIRGLTLRHPWAWAFLAGKDVENRTWRPEKMGLRVGDYIALHGGNPKMTPTYASEIQEAMRWIEQRGCDVAPSSLPQYPTARLGDVIKPGIVAVGKLIEVRQDSPSLWAARGQWHWCLEVKVLSEPVPHRGAQGLWRLEPDALARVRSLYAASPTPEPQP